jgi:hypothetical protein
MEIGQKFTLIQAGEVRRRQQAKKFCPPIAGQYAINL